MDLPEDRSQHRAEPGREGDGVLSEGGRTGQGRLREHHVPHKKIT